MKYSKNIVAFGVIILLYTSVLLAETTGKITGKVTDKSTGAGLPAANVVLEGTQMGASTDVDGFYVIINVPPGTHKLTVHYLGYASVKVENVTVNIDRTTKQSIALTPEAIQGETVVVQAERPIIEKDRTHSSAVVSSETIDILPVTEVSEVIELQAGVTTGSGGMHFRGGRSREVAYVIDGFPVTNTYSQSGGSNVAIQNSMIKELEVISGTFNAEYGEAQSGIVNIVTKSPAKQFHGSVKVFSGEWISRKDNIFIGIDKINPGALKDIQATITGPLPVLKDKLGFFVTTRYSNNESLHWYERRYMPIDGWTIDAYKRWYGEHFAEEVAQTGRVKIPDSLKTGDRARGPLSKGEAVSFEGKLSYFPNSSLKLTYKLNGSWNKSLGDGSWRRYQPDATSTLWGWSQQHFLSFRHMPTKNFFYFLGFSYQHKTSTNYFRKDNRVADYPGDIGIQPIGSSANGFSLGNTDAFYTGKDGKNFDDLYMLKGDFNWQIGKYNFVKAGFQIIQHNINTYSWGYRETEEWQRNKYTPAINGKDYEWSQYWDAMVNYWKNWNETMGTTKYRKVRADEITLYKDYTIKPLDAAFYLQDKVELGEIICNVGVRLDVFKPYENVIKNKRVESYLLGSEGNLKEAPVQYQLSPRFGISYPISDNGAFHVAYGHFFQRTSIEKMYNEPLYTLTPIQLEDRRLGNAGLKPERTIAYEIGLQQGITSDLSVNVTAYYKDMRNLLGIERVTTVDAIGYTRYINRDYGSVKGFTVALKKWGAGLISGSIDYTLQFAKGSASNPEFLQLIEIATRRGGKPVQFVERQILPLDWDKRHIVNAMIGLSLPGNWRVSFIGTLNGGEPYTPEFVEVFELAEREFKNTASKPMQWNVDFKAMKYFNFAGLKYNLFLKVDNVFDHLNENFVYATTGRATENARLPSIEDIERTALKQEGNFTLGEVDNRPEWFSQPRRVELGLEVLF